MWWTGGAVSRAFSLIEVLVVISLLSVIIIGLAAMFGQTQRAFKLGTAQVDVLEGGRLVTDMMTREISQMSAADQYNQGLIGAVNCDILLHNVGPSYQELVGTAGRGRTNLLEDFFFLSEENQRWTGIGYRVLDPATGQWPQGGIGTLYRYETNAFFHQPLWEPFDGYSNARYTNMTSLLDRVVHFTVRAFDNRGVWINQSRWSTNSGTNIVVTYDLSFLRDEPYRSTFYSNSVPASVELEIGILEERAAERARSISDPTARSAFLAQQAGKVHLFRWRVPVRNVDPTAYQ